MKRSGSSSKQEMSPTSKEAKTWNHQISVDINTGYNCSSQNTNGWPSNCKDINSVGTLKNETSSWNKNKSIDIITVDDNAPRRSNGWGSKDTKKGVNKGGA